MSVGFSKSEKSYGQSGDIFSNLKYGKGMDVSFAPSPYIWLIPALILGIFLIKRGK